MTNLKILVAEDDPVTLKLLEKKLTNAEYEVELARDGVEAVDIISESYFDVVLTDLMMPGYIDGIGVLEYVKEKYGQTEVILITAFASVESAVEAMKKGATDYLTKPINFDELMLRLDRIRTVKSLAKESIDLREAMDVTERNAGETIQDLEMMVYELQLKCSEIKGILSENGDDEYDRIERALKVLNPLTC